MNSIELHICFTVEFVDSVIKGKPSKHMSCSLDCSNDVMDITVQGVWDKSVKYFLLRILKNSF